ncbi:MAG: L-serine ammonia-lyase, iron-sulfur-dependent, subunit beta [Clostridiales bacterium]|nr:L-serine ammonia-lyase, iron-sulfur-dependent, subunit beta [Clostridiales bacterium]
MRYRSVFDIIGPVMIGPSSSHTAGAVRIGQLARALFGRTPSRAVLHFYGSFAKTYRGHATDVAAVAGLLGLPMDDPRIPDAIELARAQDIVVEFVAEEAIPAHPNTLTIELTDARGSFRATGVSLGGGLVQITEVDGFSLKLSGDWPALLIFHRDAYGTIAAITQQLARAQVNINHMEVSRSDRGKTALMVIETDEKVEPEVVGQMEAQPNVYKIVTLNP